MWDALLLAKLGIFLLFCPSGALSMVMRVCLNPACTLQHKNHNGILHLGLRLKEINKLLLFITRLIEAVCDVETSKTQTDVDNARNMQR